MYLYYVLQKNYKAHLLHKENGNRNIIIRKVNLLILVSTVLP